MLHNAFKTDLDIIFNVPYFLKIPNRFRARGPSIHRKMDLSQVPRGPIGSIDDPLADPYDDPSYGFGFRTSDYQRREDGDSTGRVRGNRVAF